ncbi:MAG: tetratricopeptide repeat protein [Verrucomicrobiales bacterium]|nr:tetratricopeptide repeat protein [Verrucomicrobiales bacterium]
MSRNIHPSNSVEEFFDNLLPDNRQIRERIQQRFCTPSVGAFDLLQEIGARSSSRHRSRRWSFMKANSSLGSASSPSRHRSPLGPRRMTCLVYLVGTLILQSAEPSAFEKRILALVDRQNFGQAVTLLEREIELEKEPNVALRYHGFLGDIYSAMYEIDKAVTHYDVILKTNPQDPSLYFRKARIVGAKLDRREEALGLIDTAIAKGLQDTEAYAMQGFLRRLAYEAAQDPKERATQLKLCLGSYGKAVELDPRNIAAWGNSADLMFNAGLYPEAEAAYRKVLALAPQSLKASTQLAHAQIRQGQVESGLKRLRQAEQEFDRMAAPKGPPMVIAQWLVERASVQFWMLEALITMKRDQELKAVAEKLLKMMEPPPGFDQEVESFGKWRSFANATLAQLDQKPIQPGPSR